VLAPARRGNERHEDQERSHLGIGHSIHASSATSLRSVRSAGAPASGRLMERPFEMSRNLSIETRFVIEGASRREARLSARAKFRPPNRVRFPHAL